MFAMAAAILLTALIILKYNSKKLVYPSSLIAAVSMVIAKALC